MVRIPFRQPKRLVSRRRQLIPVRCEPEIVRRLDVLALQQNRYRSELIREAINDYLNKREAFKASS